MREPANSNTARDFGDENMIAGMLIGMPFQSSTALTIGGAAMIQGVWTVTKVGRASLLLACRGRWSRWELGDSRVGPGRARPIRAKPRLDEPAGRPILYRGGVSRWTRLPFFLFVWFC